MEQLRRLPGRTFSRAPSSVRQQSPLTEPSGEVARPSPGEISFLTLPPEGQEDDLMPSRAPASSPPAATPPAHGRCVGREELLKYLMERLRPANCRLIILSGPRRIGKSVILHALEQQLSAPFIPLYFDLNGRAAQPLPLLMRDLAVEIIGRIGHTPPERRRLTDVGHARRQLQEALQAIPAGQRLVLLLDEFDVPSEPLSADACARRLFHYLQELSGQFEALSFVIAQGRARTLETAYARLPLFETAPLKRVHTLSPSAVRQLLEGLFDTASGAFEPVLRCITDLTGRQPALIQLLGTALQEQLHANQLNAPPTQADHPLSPNLSSRQRAELSVVDLMACVPRALRRGETTLHWMWNGFTPAEQEVLKALAVAATPERPVTFQALLAFFSRQPGLLGEGPLEPALEDTLRSLEEIELIRRESPGRYCLQAELFRRHVAEAHTSVMQREALDRPEDQAGSASAAAVKKPSRRTEASRSEAGGPGVSQPEAPHARALLEAARPSEARPSEAERSERLRPSASHAGTARADGTAPLPPRTDARMDDMEAMWSSAQAQGEKFATPLSPTPPAPAQDFASQPTPVAVSIATLLAANRSVGSAQSAARSAARPVEAPLEPTPPAPVTAKSAPQATPPLKSVPPQALKPRRLLPRVLKVAPWPITNPGYAITGTQTPASETSRELVQPAPLPEPMPVLQPAQTVLPASRLPQPDAPESVQSRPRPQQRLKPLTLAPRRQVVPAASPTATSPGRLSQRADRPWQETPDISLEFDPAEPERLADTSSGLPLGLPDSDLIFDPHAVPPRARTATELHHVAQEALDLALSEADQLLMGRRFAEARERFERVLRQDPQQPEALIGLARSLYELGQFEEAVRCLLPHLANPAIQDVLGEVYLFWLDALQEDETRWSEVAAEALLHLPQHEALRRRQRSGRILRVKRLLAENRPLEAAAAFGAMQQDMQEVLPEVLVPFLDALESLTIQNHADADALFHLLRRRLPDPRPAWQRFLLTLLKEAERLEAQHPTQAEALLRRADSATRSARMEGQEAPNTLRIRLEEGLKRLDQRHQRLDERELSQLLARGDLAAAEAWLEEALTQRRSPVLEDQLRNLREQRGRVTRFVAAQEQIRAQQWETAQRLLAQVLGEEPEFIGPDGVRALTLLDEVTCQKLAVVPAGSTAVVGAEALHPAGMRDSSAPAGTSPGRQRLAVGLAFAAGVLLSTAAFQWGLWGLWQESSLGIPSLAERSGPLGEVGRRLEDRNLPTTDAGTRGIPGDGSAHFGFTDPNFASIPSPLPGAGSPALSLPGSGPASVGTGSATSSVASSLPAAPAPDAPAAAVPVSVGALVTGSTSSGTSGAAPAAASGASPASGPAPVTTPARTAAPTTVASIPATAAARSTAGAPGTGVAKRPAEKSVTATASTSQASATRPASRAGTKPVASLPTRTTASAPATVASSVPVPAPASSDGSDSVGLGGTYNAHHAGLVAVKAGKYDDAFQLYRQAIAEDGRNAEIWTDLGELYVKQGRSMDALRAFQKSLSLEKGQIRAWYAVGKLQQTQGHKEEALAAFQRVVQQAAGSSMAEDARNRMEQLNKPTVSEDAFSSGGSQQGPIKLFQPASGN